MAEIDSHVSRRSGEQGKAMGYCSKTNRGRHIHAGRKSLVQRAWTGIGDEAAEDRKSTRLNSSHITISYAVFCLKKKKTRTSHAHCFVMQRRLSSSTTDGHALHPVA